MRVVAGRFKGRVLKAPKGRDTRPTTDRVREAMASSIVSANGGPVTGAVLDAFAGSGALGLEALSRGAASCVFYERARPALAALKANVAALGLRPGQARVVPRDIMAACSRGAVAGGPFSLVLLDPPYKTSADEVAGLLEGLAVHGKLETGCVVVYEHSAEAAGGLPGALAGRPLETRALKTYGITEVTIAVLSA